MPNHCENHTNISGEVSALRELRDAMLDADGEYRLANVMPVPEGQDAYHWCWDNWGTKWGDYDHWSDDAWDIHEYGDGMGYMDASYMTAWGPFSLGFWLAVSRRFPSLSFETTCEEGNNGFVGAVVASNGVGAEEFTDQLPVYPDGSDDEWDVPDYCDAMCDLREQMLLRAQAKMELDGVTA